MVPADVNDAAAGADVASETWRALLTGEIADKAKQTVEEIAARLANGLPAGGYDVHALGVGKPGLAVLYSYLAVVCPGRGFEEIAGRLQEECLDLLEEVRMDASLFEGFCGIAWMLAHLDGRDREAGEEHPNAEIDRVLLDYLRTSPWHGHFDLISGLVGCGVYALERIPDPLGVSCLEQVVARLEELALRSEGEVTWHTAPARIVDSEIRHAPAGYLNLGVAHGVPGVIALLAAACRVGVAEEQARSLMEGAVRWLLSQRLPDDRGARFPFWLAAGREPNPARSGWCYGDPGIAATLLVAARCAGVAEWEREAVGLARFAARRPFEETGVRDAGLCHGAAGLGHLFNRMYQATGDPELAVAAVRWFERALQMRRPDMGLTGFLAHVGTDPDRWEEVPGLTVGAVGIALALLAATSAVAPAWDRLFLVSPTTAQRPLP